MGNASPTKPCQHEFSLSTRKGDWYCDSCGKTTYRHRKALAQRFRCDYGCSLDLCHKCLLVHQDILRDVTAKGEKARSLAAPSPAGAAVPAANPLSPEQVCEEEIAVEQAPSLPSVVPDDCMSTTTKEGLPAGAADELFTAPRDGDDEDLPINLPVPSQKAQRSESSAAVEASESGVKETENQFDSPSSSATPDKKKKKSKRGKHGKEPEPSCPASSSHEPPASDAPQMLPSVEFLGYYKDKPNAGLDLSCSLQEVPERTQDADDAASGYQSTHSDPSVHTKEGAATAVTEESV